MQKDELNIHICDCDLHECTIATESDEKTW